MCIIGWHEKVSHMKPCEVALFDHIVNKDGCCSNHTIMDPICAAFASSRVAGSTIREGDIPLSKVLKTSGFVASLQKVAKEFGDRGIVGFHFVR